MNSITEKKCACCKEVKPVDMFSKSNSKKYGLYSWCRSCSTTKQKEWRDKNPEKKREHDKKYRSNKDRYKNIILKKNFRITINDYQKMLEDQRGRCGICGNEAEDGRYFSVDHDHDTGQIRGLLCGNCNRAIGQLQDSPEILKKAIIYLEANKNYPIVPKELMIKNTELSKNSRKREVERWKKARIVTK